jgi:hypothetical protein
VDDFGDKNMVDNRLGCPEDETAKRTDCDQGPDHVRSSAWPIEPSCLSALLDLGLSNRKIASYFRIDEAEVLRLRRC